MKIEGERHYAAWHAPQCPLVIEYSRALLAEIDLGVHEAFFSAPRGGVETAGLLFGIHLEGVLRLTAFRPMQCEHLHGPSFLVSDKDLTGLHALIERSRHDPMLEGSTLVGWYHSHTRSGIFLSQADLELHRRFFPEGWQVALVLRPSTNGATRAGFFFQEADGTIHSQECYQEFELAEAGPAGHGKELALPPPRGTERPELGLTASRKPTRSSTSMRAGAPTEAAPWRVPVPPSTVAMSNRLRPAAVAGSKSKNRYWPWVVAGLVMGIGGASWYQSGTGRPSSPTRTTPLHLRVTDQAGLLDIEWDRNILGATELLGGNLGIRDGETRTNLPLDRAAIKAGSFQVVRHSARIWVTLQIRLLGAAPIEEAMEFSGPMPQRVEVAEAAARAPDADTARRPEAASENAVAGTTAGAPPAANRTVEKLPPAPSPSDRKDECGSDSSRHEPPSAPAAAPSQENVATPPRQQTAEAAKPLAPAAISPPRPPGETPFPPAASQAAQNAPSVPRPGPAATQPEGPGTTPNPAPVSPSPPRAAPAPVQPPKPVAAPLSGRWVHLADEPSGSPFPPESLRLTLNESAGQVRGSFSGSYKIPKNRKVNGRVDFQFAGPSSTGSARFPFNGADGSKGEVEIIRVPGHVDTIEVVWHSSRDQITFDDVFQRVP